MKKLLFALCAIALIAPTTALAAQADPDSWRCFTQQFYDSRHSALLDVDGDLVTGSATGAVATAGVDVYQKVPFAGGAITVVGPATYFVATIFSGTTDRYNAHGTATTGLGFATNLIAGKITGQTYGAIPATNTVPMTYTTDLGPIASLY